MRINRKLERMMFFSRSMDALGVTVSDAYKLRRIEMTLSRWSERECNGEVERDEKTGKAWAVYGQDGPGPIRRYPTADKEAGAIKRLAVIMVRYPRLTWYHQTDPRGCALYVGKKSALEGLDVSAYYSRRMIAVCC